MTAWRKLCGEMTQVNEDGKPVIVRSQDASGPKGVRTIITHEDASETCSHLFFYSCVLVYASLMVLAIKLNVV